MNIEEEIARALNRSGWTCEYGSDEPGNYDECEDCRRVCDKQAAALSPLLNRVRAEALREASWKYILECRTPADVRDMIRAEAARIEQNSEGSEA